jgi:hypothetical protein
MEGMIGQNQRGVTVSESRLLVKRASLARLSGAP